MKRKLLPLALFLSMAMSLFPTSVLAAEAIPSSGTAYAAEQTVLIDGNAVRFQAYMLLDAQGNGTNYIKLRDLAMALNGSAAQFEVEYTGSIGLVTGKSYTPAGGEMTTPFSGNRPYTGGVTRLNVNGVPTDLTALTLLDDSGLGYTYFKLRDLGAVLGFGVDWDSSAQLVVLVTSDGGAAEKPAQDNSQTAMARAMLDILNRGGSARLVDADGDGVKELIVLDGFLAKLYDWNNGQLSAKEIGAAAGGQIEWWLCQNTSTGERGVEYHTEGAAYDNSTIFYPTREISLQYSHSDDGSSDFQAYYIGGREVSQAEYNLVRGQNWRLEYLLSDMDIGEPGPLVEIRAELECLAAGKTLREISDEALLRIAQRLEDEVSSMDIYIMNGWPTECDYNDFILVDMGGGSTECYRVIGYTNVEEILSTAEKLWYQIVSRSDSTFELVFAPNIRERYIARNGALYRHDLGMGDGGYVGIIDRLVSRTADRAIFSGHTTHDGTDNLGSFQISLVYEDGTWKYGAMYGAPDGYN